MHVGIRSTSGRYTSHRNAFLFLKFLKNPMKLMKVWILLWEGQGTVPPWIRHCTCPLCKINMTRSGYINNFWSLPAVNLVAHYGICTFLLKVDSRKHSSRMHTARFCSSGRIYPTPGVPYSPDTLPPDTLPPWISPLPRRDKGPKI